MLIVILVIQFMFKVLRDIFFRSFIMKSLIKLVLLTCFSNIISNPGENLVDMIRLSDGEIVKSNDQNMSAKDKWSEVITVASFEGVDDTRHDEIMDDERYTK